MTVTRHKSKIFRTLLIMCSLLSLFSTFGFARTVWLTEADTGSVVTLGRVECTIVEEYENGITIMPGDTVRKVVSVRNDGNVDELIRLRIDLSWSSDRDIPTDNIKIEINDEYWKYDAENGWYYYAEIVPPGELTVPVFDEYTLDGRSVGNDMAGLRANIDITADAVQADCFYDRNPGWQSESSVYAALLSPESDGVEFVSPSAGFEFEYSGESFLDTFSLLVPGEERDAEMTVKNGWNKSVSVFMRPEMPDQTEIPESFLRDYVTLRVISGEESVYEGPFDSGTDIEMGDIKPLESVAYTVNISVRPEAGNEYADVISDVKWNFRAAGESSGNPQTGEEKSTVFVFLFILGLAGSVVSYFLLKKERTGEDYV